ncbi:MAG: hypothetical protein EON53_03450 [Actinomycetales bacterium]|nr:MAG: hypothetical protein EON53_03450 [Actinomycetales bacterium]
MSTPGTRAPRPATRRRADAAVACVVLLVLVSVGGAVAAVVLGMQPLVVRSGSMAPDLDPGALAVARPVPASEVAVGDVVSVIDDDGERVTHRVVAIDPVAASSASLRLRLKGDANPTADARTYTVASVDRVVLDVPLLGHPVSWLSGPAGTVLVVGGAGLVVLLALRRPGGRRGVALPVLVLVLGTASLVGVERTVGTDAAFTDVADFEAGVVAAHGVRAFDLDGGSAACENIGTASLGYYGSVRIKWKVKDTRYDTEWTSPQLTNGGTKIDAQVAAVGTSVSTTFRSAALGLGTNDVQPSLTGGTIQVVGRSRARTAPTWVSPDSRTVLVERQALALGGVRCGTVSVQPTVILTGPTGSGTTSAVQGSVDTACGTSPRAAACGTAQATVGRTVSSVSYELRREALLQITQCWNGTGYSAFTCGTWRDATVAGTNPVTWRVPGTNAYGGTLFTGTYTLTIRVTDSVGQTTVQVWTYTAS